MLLRLDAETGRLYWRDRPEAMFPSRRAANMWNARYAGREAFTSSHIYGYRHGSIENRSYRAHRVVFAIFYCRWPRSEVDHINGDRSDNRPRNLREVTRAENSQNMARRRDNKSGATGVHWRATEKKWQARIKISGRYISLGLHSSLLDAIAARKAAEIAHDFHPNHGRDPISKRKD